MFMVAKARVMVVGVLQAVIFLVLSVVDCVMNDITPVAAAVTIQLRKLPRAWVEEIAPVKSKKHTIPKAKYLKISCPSFTFDLNIT
jgi:hypothetical protein